MPNYKKGTFIHTAAIWMFVACTFLTLLSPIWVFRDLLFPYITSKAYFLRITVAIALPFYLYLVLSVKHYRPSWRNPLTLAVVAFFVFNLISALFGVNPLKSLWGNFERMGGVFYQLHLSLYYFYILLLAQMGHKYIRAFVLGVVWLGAGMAIYGSLVWMKVLNFLPDPSYPRISATFGNPIFFASFLILPMFLTLYLLVSESSKAKKLGYGVLIALELWAILLSQTRGAVVGLVLAIFVSSIVYIVFTKRKSIRIWGGVGMLTFVLLVGIAFSQHEKFPQGSMLRRVFNLRDSNTDARFIQWRIALRGFADSPLLGTGSENYSVISNKYYNPEIFNYDRSWFDKPHNYILEILVTNGILGFLAYAAIIAAVLWGLYKGYRQDLLSLGEFCLLLTGILAYEVQNIFVFDTIPASLTFFAYLGFAGYLWHELQSADQKAGRQYALEKPFVYTAAGLATLMVGYGIFATNITGLRIAKNINYGYAYSQVDPGKANSYFQIAHSIPFNFDPVEASGKYSDFAASLAGNAQAKDQQLAKEVLAGALAEAEKAVQRVPSDPTAQQRLANLYLTKATLEKTTIDEKGLEASRAAAELAPQRPEPLLFQSRLEIFRNNLPAAQAALEKLLAAIPSFHEARLQLALLYAFTGQEEKAIAQGEMVLTEQYEIKQSQEAVWLAELYAKRGQHTKAAALYERIVKVEPNNIDIYWRLARVYAELGLKDKARSIAEAIAKYDPSRKDEMAKFLETLK